MRLYLCACAAVYSHRRTRMPISAPRTEAETPGIGTDSPPPVKPEHIDPQPARTTPNGYCIDCGAKLARRDALRCRKHASLLANRTKAGTFDSKTGQRMAVKLHTRRRAERAELERLRAIFANRSDTHETSRPDA